MWETDEPVPTRDFAIAQDNTAFAGRKLLLDGQQRLTSLHVSVERRARDRSVSKASYRHTLQS